MKVLLVVFAIIGFTYGQTVAGGFEEIGNHMPKEEMKGAATIFNDGDAETQSFVRTVQGAEFRGYLNDVL